MAWNIGASQNGGWDIGAAQEPATLTVQADETVTLSEEDILVLNHILLVAEGVDLVELNLAVLSAPFRRQEAGQLAPASVQGGVIAAGGVQRGDIRGS